MNNILDIKTPAQSEAAVLKSDYGLVNHGIENLRMAYWNLPTEALYEEITFRREARISHLGPIIANTGKHTARSANDKFIVKEPSTENQIWWGQYNRPSAPTNSTICSTGCRDFCREGCFRAGLLRRRRPELSNADPYHQRVCMARNVCAKYVHSSTDE